jgi:DNA-binding transcriptional LysR family regulator
LRTITILGQSKYGKENSMITLSLRRIQTFAAVAEYGSFRMAGEQLHRSPSAVSAHIIQLEQELGVPLFNRTTRKVSLTDSGQALLLRCKIVLADLDTAVHELREESQIRRGRVSIGSTPAMLGTRLPPILAMYRRRYPGVLVTLKEDFAKNVYAHLATGETDFAIGPRINGFRDFDFTPIIDNPFVVVMPVTMTVPRNNCVKLKDVMAYPQITLPLETASRQVVEMLFMQHGMAFSTDYEVKQLQSLFALVAAGLGVAIMPNLGVPPSKGKKFRTARLIEPSANQEICIVTARGKRLSAPAQACKELIIRRAQKNKDHNGLSNLTPS